MGTVLNLPNQITILRLLLSVVFFVLLGLFDQKYWKFVGQPLPADGAAFLNISTAIFILTAFTDFLDGYLARKWKMISTFGRIADPFVDKVFICGSFIFLIPITPLVPTWFVVVVIMREFLVSGLRSFIESRGVPFGAGLSGKLKMLSQSVAIPAVLIYRANLQEHPGAWWTVWSLLALTLLFTVVSSADYVRRAMGLLRP